MVFVLNPMYVIRTHWLRIIVTAAVLMAEVPMAVTAVVPMVATFASMSKATHTVVKFAEVAKYPLPLKNLNIS
jgi:hypothetical protein